MASARRDVERRLSAGCPSDELVEILEIRRMRHTFDFSKWLDRIGCEGDSAERVRQLWGERVSDNRLTLDKIAIHAVRAA